MELKKSNPRIKSYLFSISDKDNQKLERLVESGKFRSRSDAIAFLIRRSRV